MTPIAVLYDGWPLVYEPNSPAALHLDLLLGLNQEDLQISLALPGDLPAWFSLPNAVQVHRDPTPNTSRGKLRWAQQKLNAGARRLEVDLIHLTHASPPLIINVPTLVSPAVYPAETTPAKGLFDRLRRALGQGGLARASGVLWPVDLPKPIAGPETFPLTPHLSPDYTPGEAAERPPALAHVLPETYLLYHGPYGSETLNLLLEIWRWGAGSIGELYPLVLAGVNATERNHVFSRIRLAGLESYCRVLPVVPIAVLPALYQGCSAVLHPAPAAPWGGALRRALACGRPVIAIENSLTDALVGPAGYVLPAAEVRRLGAALITVVVEETIAEKLGELGRARAAHWQAGEFGNAVRAVYKKVLRNGF